MDEKYLLYDSQTAGKEKGSLFDRYATWLWNDRLILVEHKSDREFWRFTALDLITNETRPIHFLKSNSKFHRVEMVTLANDYGFVVESNYDSFCVNLVKLNWAPGEFQVIERFEQEHGFSAILVDNLSPTKFVLRQWNGGRYIYQAFTLDSGKVEFIKTLQSNEFFEHYFDDKLYRMNANYQVHTYDWVTKKSDAVAINELPNVEVDIYRTEWVKERLYAAVYFYDTKMDGIGYTDLETTRWTLLDFVTNMRIYEIQYFDGSLIMYAENYKDYYDGIDRFKFKNYSIPVRHPQSLRKMAWQLVVQRFKRDKKITNPYQTAVQFLPFNSDLRPLWYSEEAALEQLDEKASNEQSQKLDDAALEDLDEPESNEQEKPGWMQVFKAMLSQLKQLLGKQAKAN